MCSAKELLSKNVHFTNNLRGRSRHALQFIKHALLWQHVLRPTRCPLPNNWLKSFAPLTRDRRSRPLSQTLGVSHFLYRCQHGSCVSQPQHQTYFRRTARPVGTQSAPSSWLPPTHRAWVLLPATLCGLARPRRLSHRAAITNEQAQASAPNNWFKPLASLARDRHSRPLNQTLEVNMIIEAPTWYAKGIICPCCDQGHPQFISCPTCSAIALVCLEVGTIFPDPKKLSARAEQAQACTHCKSTKYQEFPNATDLQLIKSGYADAYE